MNKSESNEKRTPKIRLETLYENCLVLGGAVIKMKMWEYTYALYYQAKGIKSYHHHAIKALVVNTKDAIINCEKFFFEGGCAFWSDELIDPVYIMNEAKKEAQKMLQNKRKLKEEKNAGQSNAILDVADKND